MNYLIYFLIASNLSTAAFATYLFRKYKTAPPKKESLELKEFIRELMSGEAIVRISVIDPANLLLRTRRGG